MAFLSEVFLSCHFSFLLLCLLPPLRAWRAVSLFQIARQCTFIRGGYELRRASSHTEHAPVASSDIGGDMPSCRLLCRSKRIRQEQSARLYCHSCAFITSRKSWQMINPASFRTHMCQTSSYAYPWSQTLSTQSQFPVPG